MKEPTGVARALQEIADLKAAGVDVVPQEKLKKMVAGALEDFGPALWHVLFDEPAAKNYLAFNFRSDLDKPSENDFAVVLLKRGGVVPANYWDDK